MYALKHNITVNDSFKLNKILDIRITKTLSSFTNNCVISVPKYLRVPSPFLNSNQPAFTDFGSTFFKKGDRFSIKLGYQYLTNMYLEDEQFYGFLSNIEVLEHTVNLHLEDYSYFLKKVKFNFSDANATLSTIGNLIETEVNKIIPQGVPKIKVINNFNFAIKDFIANNATASQILDLLKGNYVLDSYFVKNELNLGVNFDKIKTNVLPQNVKSFSTYRTDVIKGLPTNKKYYKILNLTNLKYKNSDDIIYGVTLKNIVNGKSTETKFGDDTGDHRDFIFFGDQTQKEKEEFVKNQLEKIKYSGFMKGSSFLTYGLPYIDIKDVISFDGIGFIRRFNQTVEGQANSVYDRSSYLVDGVSITYGQSGFHQEIILSNKIAVNYSDQSLVQLLGQRTINQKIFKL